MRVIELNNGALHLRVAPETGGAPWGFWSRRDEGRFDWFRPGGVSDGADALAASCFPLVPYSNRIRKGRFRFQGDQVALPRNFGDHPHSIHGHGWQAPWRVIEAARDRLVLSYRHAPDAWPFAYQARQAFRLSESALEISLELENLAESEMPAGLGLHPYFPLRGSARLTASVSGVWLTDDEAMPTERIAPPPRWDLSRGAEIAGMEIDNVFDGWDGAARIAWPGSGAALTITADVPLRHLVVFAPPGSDFFCVEPVSHMTDAFNLAAGGLADTGMRVVAPGETLSARVTFAPEPSS